MVAIPFARRIQTISLLAYVAPAKYIQLVIDSINSFSLRKNEQKASIRAHWAFFAVDMVETIDEPELILW